jgi:transposase-like protein
VKKPVKRRGRPRELCPEIIEAVRTGLEGGLSMSATCGLIGIDRGTVYRWKAKGAEEEDGLYADLYAAIESANANAMQKALDAIYAALDPEGKKYDWRAAAWFLERRFPQEWGQKQEVTQKKIRVKTVRLLHPELVPGARTPDYEVQKDDPQPQLPSPRESHGHADRQPPGDGREAQADAGAAGGADQDRQGPGLRQPLPGGDDGADDGAGQGDAD